MTHSRALGCLTSLVALFGTSSVAEAQVSRAHPTINGHWRVEDGSATIAFERCGTDLCGRIVQLRDTPNAPDENNRIRALRDRPVCGLVILSRLQPSANGRWTGGRLYDPESGHSLGDLSVERRGETLRVAIGSGPFAGHETWRPAAAPSKPCRGA